MQRSSQPLNKPGFLYATSTYKPQSGGNQTSFKYLLASFISVIRLYNPSHASHCIKKKKKSYILHFRQRHIYYPPYDSRGSSSLPDCFLPTSFYWWFYVSLETLSYAIVLGAKGAETFAVQQRFGIVGQSGFGLSWNLSEEQNAFYFHQGQIFF